MHQILHEDAPLLSEAGAGLVGRAYDAVQGGPRPRQARRRGASRAPTTCATRLRTASAEAAASPLATMVGR